MSEINTIKGEFLGNIFYNILQTKMKVGYKLALCGLIKIDNKVYIAQYANGGAIIDLFLMGMEKGELYKIELSPTNEQLFKVELLYTYIPIYLNF